MEIAGQCYIRCALDTKLFQSLIQQLDLVNLYVDDCCDDKEVRQYT